MSESGERALAPQIVRTPEGIDLHFVTAAASERMVALLIDLGIVLLLLLAASIPFGWLFGPAAPLLLLFLLRHGYFVWCEVRGNGSTPGKRRFHLRVIRADGGPLTTEVLLARNLTREVELFLPGILLLAPDLVFADHQGVVRLLATLWILGLMFFPLLHPQRLRIGDLLAGTRVVRSPPVQLARDLADAKPAAAGAPPEFHFPAQQLAVYGEHELTVLEDLLRKARLVGGDEAVAAVAATIARKLGRADVPEGRDGAVRFLQAFYKAQRQHLEQQLLLGRRRLRKAPGPSR